MREPPGSHAARWPWGLAVVATTDLRNDGTHPGAEPDALIVAAGRRGEIVNIGHHTETDRPVYLVDFGGTLVGVLEDEIAPA